MERALMSNLTMLQQTFSLDDDHFFTEKYPLFVKPRAPIGALQ